jgi:hypothetical protein
MKDYTYTRSSFKILHTGAYGFKFMELWLRKVAKWRVSTTFLF